MNENYIICKICGWKGRQITTGHLKEHNIKAENYKQMFPGAEMTCLATRKLTSQAAKKRQPQTEEKKKRISESMKKVYRETNFSLRLQNEDQEGEKNSFFNKRHTEETKKEIGKKSTEWLLQAYQSGNKISPFSWLGQGNQMSQNEIEIYRLLKPLGFIFDYPIPFSKGRYLIDFAYLERKTGIEIDSPLHNDTVERDKRKDKYLAEKGWKIYRIKISERELAIDLAERVLIFAKKLLKKEF